MNILWNTFSKSNYIVDIVLELIGKNNIQRNTWKMEPFFTERQG